MVCLLGAKAGISKPQRLLELIEIISIYCYVQSFQCVALIAISKISSIYTVLEAIKVISHCNCKVKICMNNERIRTHIALVPDSFEIWWQSSTSQGCPSCLLPYHVLQVKPHKNQVSDRVWRPCNQSTQIVPMLLA